MSNLKLLEKKIADMKKKTEETISLLIKEVDEYNATLEKSRLKEDDLAVLMNTASKKQVMQGLLSEIEALISKANNGIKNKPGAPSIRNFLKEVKAKMRSMLKNIKESEIRESAQRIIDSITKLEEGSPEGSFEAIREKVQEALRSSGMFVDPINPDRTPWIKFLFSDKVIIDFRDKNFQIPFAITKDVVKFGESVEVTEEFVVKESKSSLAEFKKTENKDIKENNITNKGKPQQSDLDFGYVSLGESTFNVDTGEISVILIEAGTNDMKRRHYPVKTIEEAAPLFTGLKMYINHPTKSEEKERPERNLTDWASTIMESRAIDGKAVAKVSVHDPWLRERLSNQTFRENVGLSINAGGLVSHGKVNGKDMQIVEKITLNRRNGPASVDWVTEAGARGRVAKQLFESRGRKKTMELNDVTLTEMLKERPDLIKELKESIVNELKESKESKEKEAKLKEALEKIETFEKEKIASGNKTLVESWLKEKKVAAVLHERITESLQGKEFKNETELKEAFDASVKKEVEFLNKIGGKGKINLSEGKDEDGKSLIESLGDDLDDRTGIKKEKEEDK